MDRSRLYRQTDGKAEKMIPTYPQNFVYRGYKNFLINYSSSFGYLMSIKLVDALTTADIPQSYTPVQSSRDQALLVKVDTDHPVHVALKLPDPANALNHPHVSLDRKFVFILFLLSFFFLPLQMQVWSRFTLK